MGRTCRSSCFRRLQSLRKCYESKENQIKKPCSDLWRRMFIWWDGKTNPCDTDYKSKLSTGNFGNNSLSNIWLSKAYNELREITDKK